MKKNVLKCENCGSSKFRQIAEDLFECEYCLAKIQNDNSVKNDFMADIDGNKYRKTIKYIKVNVGEDEFYKKALAHLVVNKHTPKDLLEKGNLGYVNYKYLFFAVLDIDFTAMTVGAANDDLVSIASNQQINNTIGKHFCIELSDDIDNRYMNEVMGYIDELNMYTQDVASSSTKSDKINIPKKEVIEKKIDECLADYKQKILSLDKISNHVVHKILNIEIVALPVYTLNFEYDGKQYTLSSSAHNLNIIGSFPNNGNALKKQAEKKVLPFTVASTILSLGAIIFAIVHLSLRLLGFIKYDIIAAGVALIAFAVSAIAYKIVYNKKSKEIYEQKLKGLKDFLQKNEKSLSKNDEEYIEKFLRWF